MAGRGPRDWARDASQRATTGIISPVRMGGQAPADDDPEEAELRKMESDERRLARLDQIEEARRTREERANTRTLRVQLEQVRLQRMIANGGVDPNDSPGGGGSGKVVDQLVAQLARERQETFQLLATREQQAQAQSNNSLMQEIAGLRQAVTNISLTPPAGTIPGEGPIQQLVRSLEDVKRIQTVLNDVAPAPAPPPIDPGLSRQQQIEQDKMHLEAELREYDKKIALETIQYKREELVAEKQHKQERLDRLMGGLENALGPLLAAAAGGGLANLFGGGGGGGGGGSNGAAPEVAPQPAQQIHYQCPNCKATNYVPMGTTVTACPRCRLAPIQIQPPGAPPPPGMISA